MTQIYLLTSDHQHAVCGTNFSPMQINFFAENISDDSSLRKWLSITCQARKKIKFHRCSFREFKRAKTAERNSTTCECIFHQLAVKNVNVNVVITIYCQHNWIFLRQKKIISIHYLTGQNRGLSGLKNIWPVIMTGNLLSVICSPAPYIPIHHHTPLYITIHLYTSPYTPIQHHTSPYIAIHPYTSPYKIGRASCRERV